MDGRTATLRGPPVCCAGRAVTGLAARILPSAMDSELETMMSRLRSEQLPSASKLAQASRAQRIASGGSAMLVEHAQECVEMPMMAYVHAAWCGWLWGSSLARTWRAPVRMALDSVSPFGWTIRAPPRPSRLEGSNAPASPSIGGGGVALRARTLPG